MANQEFRCKECGAKFDSEASLHRHNRMAHSHPGYTCKECGANFDTESDLNAHARAMHPEKQGHPMR